MHVEATLNLSTEDFGSETATGFAPRELPVRSQDLLHAAFDSGLEDKNLLEFLCDQSERRT